MLDMLVRIDRHQEAIRRHRQSGYETIIFKKAKERILVVFQRKATKLTLRVWHSEAVKKNLYPVVDIAAVCNKMAGVVSA